MADAYAIVKFVHIFLAVVAVGFNASYGFWIARASRESAHLEHVLRGVKLLDDRVANPAYGLLLVTGLGMVFLGDVPFRQFWIEAALALYVLAILGGLLVYTPTLRKQIEALRHHGPQSKQYRALATKGTIVGVLLLVDVLLIVFLMVVKP